MRNSRCRSLCYFALPALLLAACVLQPSQASAQTNSLGVDCSKIDVASLMMQDNMRAGLILIQCGIVQGGHPSAFGGAHSSTTPPNVRVSNVPPAGLAAIGSRGFTQQLGHKAVWIRSARQRRAY